MSNVAIDLTKTVKEIITTMKTAIDNLNSDVATNKTAIDNLKTQILEAVYPVGSVYVSITDSSNPADILGFGTWEALPAGYGLVAQGTATAEDGSTLTFTAGQKSGEFKHQLTVGESSKHTHRIALAKAGYPNTEPQSILFLPGNTNQGINGTFSDRRVTGMYEDKKNGYYVDSEFIEATGNNQYHNNIPPYVACYLWKRTA